MEGGEYVLLEYRIQIDQHVAAAYKVQVSEGRVLEEIMVGEHDAIANGLFYFVAAIGLGKIRITLFLRERLYLARAIDPAPSLVYGRFGDIRSEDPYPFPLCAM